MTEKKRFKVVLVEDKMFPFEIEGDLNSDQLRMRSRINYLEIGWAETEQHLDGRLEVEMTLVGTFALYDGVTPDLSHIKGVIPTSLRKG